MKPHRFAVLVVAASTLTPHHGAGQVAAASQAPDTTDYGYGLQAVSPHPHGTAVAVALRLPTGSQDDQEGFEGTAWLLARVLEDEAARALHPSDAVLSATVGRASTVFTLLALPAEWQKDWARVDSVLFRAPVDSAFLAARRSELLANLRFERGSPVREFERKAAEILAAPGSPFTRPQRGTEESVTLISVQSVELYRHSFYRRGSAAEAVSGPVAVEATAPVADSATHPADSTSVAPDSAAGPSPDTSTAAPRADTAAAGPAPMAWSAGSRRVEVSDVTSTWISVAYPVSRTLPRTHLELVAHLLEEELDPTPPDPDRYDVDVRIENAPGGPVLVVEATVFPEAADRWETRILDAVTRLKTQEMREDFFSWRRRRFRTARLLEEAAPEAEATRMTADLLREGAVRDLGVEIWSLNATTLREAAEALGEPRIFLLGPDLRQSQNVPTGR